MAAGASGRASYRQVPVQESKLWINAFVSPASPDIFRQGHRSPALLLMHPLEGLADFTF